MEIGPAGGTVKTSDGASVKIPQGAVSGETPITITQSGTAPVNALGPVFDFGAGGATLLKAVQITLPYTPSPNVPGDANEPIYVIPVNPDGSAAGPILPGTMTGPGEISADTSTLGSFVAGTQPTNQILGQLSYPKGIAVNSTQVYWTAGGVSSLPSAGGVVMRAPLSGGAVEVFATGQQDPKHLAFDDTSVYWTDGGSGPSAGDAGIMKAPLTGGAPPVRIAAASFPIDIAVSGPYVVWTDYDLHTVNRAQLDGSGQVVLAQTGNAPMVLSADATNVYWLSGGTQGKTDGAVMQVAISGASPPVTLASSQAQPTSLAVDGTNVYWVTAGDGLVQRVPIGGGTGEVLRHLTKPNAIAVDATSYYVGDVDLGMLISYPKSGGTGVVRSVNQQYPNQIVLDGDSLFWVNDGTAAFQGNVQAISKTAP